MYIFFAPAVVLFLVMFAVPLAFVVGTSFMAPEWSLEQYERLTADGLVLKILINTLEISASATAITLLIGFPVAYHLARQTPKMRALLLLLVMLPLWTSILVKSFAFIVLLGREGIVNSMLQGLFGPSAQVPLLFNRVGVIIGMAHYLLPFMILTTLGSLLALDPALKRAAEIMGASKLRVFVTVTLPSCLPGLMAGTLICMILSFGMFITPVLLGGRGDIMIANLIELNVNQVLDWAFASALAILLIVLTALFVLGLAKARKGELFD